MLKVLIVKMSSLGDVIHTLPAVTDAAKAIPGITFDWVVEPAFQEIPKWHPNVARTIAAPMRTWRKQKLKFLRSGEAKAFVREIKQGNYDCIIDAQGLIKSALVTALASGPKVGLSRDCAREKMASFFYNRKYFASKKQHAVEKTRQLFAQALNYQYQKAGLDYGIDKKRLQNFHIEGEYVVFLHGTTWATKHWPLAYWKKLAEIYSAHHIKVLLPWGSDSEKLRAEEIQKHCAHKGFPTTPMVLPKLNLSQISSVIGYAKGIVAVDTGLGHVSAMMGVPTVSLYGPTYPGFTGSYGNNQVHLSVKADCHPCFAKECPKAKGNELIYPPCFSTLAPEAVWEKAQKQMLLHDSVSYKAYG